MPSGERCSALLGVLCVAATLACTAGAPFNSSELTRPLYNASSPLSGVDEAKAIVTWPIKADDSPVGIVMAGGTLGNADVMGKATGPDGALAQWKAKSKDAAKAAMDEVMEEVMEDDPDAATLGKKSSMYKELQAVAAKARKLTVKQLNIGDGGAASASANARAEGQAEAVAVMAASEADVVDSYDMPPTPEAAEDAPFARRKRNAGVMRGQKRVVSGRPATLAGTNRKAKGPSRHALTKRDAKTTPADEGTGAMKRALSAPLARLMLLFETAQVGGDGNEDPDAPTEAEAEKEVGEGEGDAEEVNSEPAAAELVGDKPMCAVGTTGPDGGPCELCPKNTYKDAEGSAACSACPAGTRTARVGTASLKDCWDGPMDSESPLGMVMAGPNLAHDDVKNKSLSSQAMRMWKARVGDAAKEAVKEVEQEILEDDLTGVVGKHEETTKELDDVVAEARTLTHSMGTVATGGEEAISAMNKAEAQADAVAFMMSHKAVIADAYSDEDSASGPLVRKGEILYPFGHHDMHKEREEIIGYPGGNRPYYAREGEEEHVGIHPDASVHGAASAYYDAARRVSSAGVQPGRMQVRGPARMQSLDALWEGIPPGSEAQVSRNVWIGAVPGLSPIKEQILQHNLEHQFLSANTGPVSLGTVATGSSAGAAGAAFTGVPDSTVWHSSWIASSDASLARPSSKILDIQASPATSYSKASTAGDRIAKQEAAALTPPGSGMRGPPEGKNGPNMHMSSTSGCSSDQIDLCHAGCDSKLNLQFQAIDPDYTSKHKWTQNCMSKCLGPCAKELGFEAAQAEKEIASLVSAEDSIIEKSLSEQAASVASDAIKRLEKKAGLGSGSASTAASETGKAGVWHYTPDAAAASSASAAASSPTSGAMPFPAPEAHHAKQGSQTGVYDCTGQALVVGAIVGRMIPGRACEDQYLVVSAGMWKVTDYRQPGAAEAVEMRHGANTHGRVGVVLHGISPNVNKDTRVELVPFVGAFTHWKLITGATRDLFLPSNVAAVTGQGLHSKSGVSDPSGFTDAFHKTRKKSSNVDKSGVLQSESVFSMQAQRQNDWGEISNIEKQDSNLAMCPGPSCPTDGPSKKHRIMHMGNPFWKYIIVALIVGSILAYQYLKRINEGVVPAGVLQQEYVQLPSMFGGGGGECIELKSKGGARPAPGQKSSERIVMVENASDRIIMVDVGAGGFSQPGAGAGDGDTASKDVGYQ